MKYRLSSAFLPVSRVLLAVAITAVWLGTGGRVEAHPATIAAATATVQPDGHFQVQARFDVLAFVLNDTTMRIGDGPMNDLLDGPVATLQSQLSAAAARFQRDFQASGGTSGPGTIDSVTFPTVADVQAWCNSGVKPRLPVMIPVTVQGHLPPGSSSVSFRFPNVLGMIVVTTEFPYREPTSEPVEAGEFSTPLPMTVAAPVPDPVSVPAAKPTAPAVAVKPAAPIAVNAPHTRSQAAAHPTPETLPHDKKTRIASQTPSAQDVSPVLPFVVPSINVPCGATANARCIASSVSHGQAENRLRRETCSVITARRASAPCCLHPDSPQSDT